MVRVKNASHPGDVFILWQLGHALLPSQKPGAAPQDN
jgi:hypothetical protein